MTEKKKLSVTNLAVLSITVRRQACDLLMSFIITFYLYWTFFFYYDLWII